MKTHKQNIGQDPITPQRAIAEVGGGVIVCKKSEADHKVTLISKPWADNKRKQETFYLKEV